MCRYLKCGSLAVDLQGQPENHYDALAIEKAGRLRTPASAAQRGLLTDSVERNARREPQCHHRPLLQPQVQIEATQRGETGLQGGAKVKAQPVDHLEERQVNGQDLPPFGVGDNLQVL